MGPGWVRTGWSWRSTRGGSQPRQQHQESDRPAERSISTGRGLGALIRHGGAREAKAWVAEPARSGCKYVIQPAPQPLRPVRSELRGPPRHDCEGTTVGARLAQHDRWPRCPTHWPADLHVQLHEAHALKQRNRPSACAIYCILNDQAHALYMNVCEPLIDLHNYTACVYLILTHSVHLYIYIHSCAPGSLRVLSLASFWGSM